MALVVVLLSATGHALLVLVVARPDEDGLSVDLGRPLSRVSRAITRLI